MARSSEGCCSLSAGTGHSFTHGAQSHRGCAHHAELGASDWVPQQSQTQEGAQQQKEMMPQIGLKARLQHGSKVHPPKRDKGRTGDKLQYMPGIQPGNTLPTSMSKTHAGDRAGDRDIPSTTQSQTRFPGQSRNGAPRPKAQSSSGP